MNKQLQDFARSWLREALAELTEGNRRIFKLAFGRQDGNRSVSDAESIHIDIVIDEVPEEKLDGAMQLVQRTLDARIVK